jgi:spore germination protein KC
VIRKLPGLMLSILLLILVSGCWNSRELNSIALAVALGIDKVGDQYLVSAQIVVPSNVASTGKSEGMAVTMLKAEGKSVFEALRRMTTTAPRKIYLAHLRVLVLGEDLAREGIASPLDFLNRDHEPRTDFFIVVAKHLSAEDVLKVATPLEKVPANRMFFSLLTSERFWAPTRVVKLDEVILDLVTEGRSPVLTTIEVTGPEEIVEGKVNTEQINPPSKLKYAGLAYFKKDKLAGWLSENDSKAYNYLNDNVNNTVGVVTCPGGGQISLEIIRTKTEAKGGVELGKPWIEANIHAEMNVGTVECQIDLMDMGIMDKLEKSANEQLEELILTSVHKAQKQIKYDVFGFGDLIHRDDPKGWKGIKDNWEKAFVDLQVDVKADVKIRRLAKVGNSFINDIKE